MAEWVSGGNTQSGYTTEEITSMTEDALQRVRQMQQRAQSYINPNTDQVSEQNISDSVQEEIYLEAVEANDQVTDQVTEDISVQVEEQVIDNGLHLQDILPRKTAQKRYGMNLNNQNRRTSRNNIVHIPNNQVQNVDVQNIEVQNSKPQNNSLILDTNDIVSLPFLKGLDSDILILGAIIFVLLQEGADKFLIMALAYILL